jgi:hypothetical protein
MCNLRLPHGFGLGLGTLLALGGVISNIFSSASAIFDVQFVLM